MTEDQGKLARVVEIAGLPNGDYRMYVFGERCGDFKTYSLANIQRRGVSIAAEAWAEKKVREAYEKAAKLAEALEQIVHDHPKPTDICGKCNLMASVAKEALAAHERVRREEKP